MFSYMSQAKLYKVSHSESIFERDFNSIILLIFCHRIVFDRSYLRVYLISFMQKRIEISNSIDDFCFQNEINILNLSPFDESISIDEKFINHRYDILIIDNDLLLHLLLLFQKQVRIYLLGGEL